ncbi:MAG TPA: histidine phosphatase family protein [Candidatus Avipropionibacterium avicola]|uniref:Histidine phosphatase family protein n=1 Tax=Candidatus Avipropionibacterium avicola TaxID=2840701 RepID=A0A9D1H0E4_9ACTN|nr:histidine phosphatase family protein [Candidatus Avipropionibacterium avicola]
MRLLLIRHGQTPNNVSGTLDTAIPGAGLTALGHTQAEAVPDALADEQIAGLYVSRLVRTHLTAAPLATARGLEARVQPGLEEISAGKYELDSSAEAVSAYRDCCAAWVHGRLDDTLGESGHDFLGRYRSALGTIAEAHGADDTVAVVSHGAAIRIFSEISTGMDPDGHHERRLRNTGMVILTGDPRTGWELTDWNEHPVGGSHLSGDASHDVTADDEAAPTA